MLKIFCKLSDLKFSDLMEIYSESNTLNGREQYDDLSEFEQIHMAEMNFYQYLNSVFFRQEDSFYAVWEISGRYVSALRIEPYQDGYLLCALETKPKERKRGYAYELIQSVIRYLAEQGSGVLYSHISKENSTSLSVHKACGFEILKDYAVYADGSVLSNNYTLTCKYEKSEIL